MTEENVCRHHWLISSPIYRFLEEGFMEVTQQRCKHCCIRKENVTPAPFDREEWGNGGAKRLNG